MNIRALGDGSMRQLKLDMISEELTRKPDVLLLAETRC